MGRAAGEAGDDRDKPRETEATPARRQEQPQNRLTRKTWRNSAGTVTRRQQTLQGVPTGYYKIPDREVADRRSTEPLRLKTAAQLITGRSIAAQEATNPGDAINRPVVQSLEDIEIAYGDDRQAIMTDFARRLAGAKTASERRAIKDQRKSALAAAKEKARRHKNARRASLLAAAQWRSVIQSGIQPG